MADAAELYDRDFYAWTQDQAARLRAWPERLRPNSLDIAHIAEELEDLGKSQRNAARSLFRQIVIHLLKIRFHPDPQPRGHWTTEVGTFRLQLEDVFDDSPSLRGRRQALFEAEWMAAARVAARSLDADGHPDAAAALRAFAAAGPYFDLDAEVLHPDWFPPAA